MKERMVATGREDGRAPQQVWQLWITEKYLLLEGIKLRSFSA
jgi:hypothetical protein